MLVFTVVVGSMLALSQAEDAVERASALLEAGDIRGAARILDAVVSSEGFSSLEPALRAHALISYGVAAEAMEDPETAAALFSRFFDAPESGASEPWVENAALGLARASLKMKDAERARWALEHLSAAARGRQPARELAATVSFFEGRLGDAEAQLSACARQWPLAQAEHLLGIILFDRGDRVGALARFEAATRLDPSDYYSWIYKVRTLLELNRAEDSLKLLDSMSPGFETAETHFLKARALLRLERVAGSLEHFTKATEMNPKYGEALFGLGTALRQCGRLADAREVLRRFEVVHRSEAEGLRKLDRMAQVLFRDPRNSGLAEELAITSLEAGDLEAAERYAWRAIRQEPSRKEARRVLARFHARVGRYGAAAIHYQRLLKVVPSDAEAMEELSELVEKHSRRKKE